MRQIFVPSILLLGIFVQPLPAEELRPVSHEDVWMMKRLGSPVVSPDGDLAVVTFLRERWQCQRPVVDPG